MWLNYRRRCNYEIGKHLGHKILAANSKLIKPEYVKKAEDFYAKHGHKAIFLARFAPIVRTLCAFCSRHRHHALPHLCHYNVSGACTWVFLFLGGGYFFGNIPFIKQNFSYVTMGIILFSLTPIILRLSAAGVPNNERRLKDVLFTSDYTTGCTPEILEVLGATNLEETAGYGEDAYCEAARALIQKECGRPDADVIL